MTCTLLIQILSLFAISPLQPKRRRAPSQNWQARWAGLLARKSTASSVFPRRSPHCPASHTQPPSLTRAPVGTPSAISLHLYNHLLDLYSTFVESWNTLQCRGLTSLWYLFVASTWVIYCTANFCDQNRHHTPAWGGVWKKYSVIYSRGMATEVPTVDRIHKAWILLQNYL